MGIGLRELLIIAAGLLVYLAPYWIALFRNHPQKKAIFVLTLFLGWTGVVWVGAFVWAVWNFEKEKASV